MNITYNKLGNVNGEIIVTIDEKDYADKVKKTLKQISQNRPEPGFRPGHTPMGLLQKKYGKAAKYDAVNEVVGEAVYNYIKENKLNVLGNPVPDAENQVNFDDAELTFKFKVGLAPQINLTVDKNITVPYYTIEVSDEMIKNQDEAFRQRFGEQVKGEEIDDNAVVKGVITELDENGTPKEGGIVVENGIVAPRHFTSDEQKALFVGHKLGDEIIFNPSATCDGNEVELGSMLNIDRDQAKNHTGNFRFDVKEIIVLKPAELNQEYFDLVFGKDNVHNEEEYRNALKDMIANQLKGDSNFRFSIDAKDAALAKVGELEYPTEILVDYLMTQNEKVSREDAEKSLQSMLPDLKWQLVRDHIAEQLNVKVEDADLKNIAEMMARQQFAQYGMPNAPQQMVDKMVENILKDKKSREQLLNQAADMKIFGAIKEAVTVDDKNVTVEEFNALFKAPEA
ncbi:MAG: trigger factor [Prevotella sp.]|nr:trigger factor [Bacteroides sp.]MCM1366171.1 trigger factor [Prevotella sp.]MCM1436764.1 trigger factor [Prevotella sp.]